jgi:guanylate kinase
MERGDLFVISAPSGAGKTTLCLRLMETLGGLAFSVSHTTRQPRRGEVNGKDYHFISPAAFEGLASTGFFLEWAEVHGNWYGTSRDEVVSRLDMGDDVLLDIDVQGGAQVRERFPEAILIFVLPPSWEVLEERLRRRGSEESSSMEIRLANARSELQKSCEYDYVVVNDELGKATDELTAIIVASRCRAVRVLRRDALMAALTPGT